MPTIDQKHRLNAIKGQRTDSRRGFLNLLFLAGVAVSLAFGCVLPIAHATTGYSYSSTNNDNACYLPDNSNIKLGRPVSWNFWVKTAEVHNYQVLFSPRISGGYAYVITLGAGDASGHVLTGISGAVWLLDSGEVLSENVWHMITVVNSSNHDYLYIDGVQKAYILDTGPQYYDAQQSIGNFGTSGSGFKGLIDEFSIFNYDLSQSDITALYNGGNGICLPVYPFNNPISSYHFDEGTGTTATDSADGNDGNVVGDATLDGENKVVCEVPEVCDSEHCDLCENAGDCVSALCYWYESACHSVPGTTCSWWQYYACTTEFSCIHEIGLGFWYDSACHNTLDPSCVVGDLNPNITNRVLCLWNNQYWAAPSQPTGQFCHAIACAAPPPLPVSSNECGGSTTSTVQFIYSDYTTDWAQPTGLFSGIFTAIGNVADPIFCWFDRFLTLFDNDKAHKLGLDTASAFTTIVANVAAFDGIFGHIPVAESLVILLLAYLIKGFFELGRKAISIFKP